jgi:tetratricopeptide (TPR) repeat protein
MLTYVLYLAHQYDQCIDQATKALELHPDSTGTYQWLAQCYEQKGMSEEAIAAYLKATSGLNNEVPRLRAAYDSRGLRGYWEEFRQWMKRNRPLDPVQEALIYSREGEKEKALTLLSLAYQQHCDGLQFLKVEPAYDGIRNEPRFKQLVKRLHL